MNKEFELNEAIEFIDNVYQHKFDDVEEIKEDGTQVIYIDKLNDMKITDFESASFTLLRGYGNLKYDYIKLANIIKELKSWLEENKNKAGTGIFDKFVGWNEFLSKLNELEEGKNEY